MRIHSGTVRVFVYGSLLPGMSNHGVIEPYVRASEPGRVRGRLIDCGPYPALLLDGNRLVRGMWMEVAREGLPALDALEEFLGIEEENDYERVWIRDADHPAVSGWVYVWTEPRGLPEAQGDWWPDVWADKR
ncbi:gamma-glutamylcyclotransferase [Cohnella sp. CFH 77786]|nr:gamma-glutamylcyclotransferase [Cohnella sp. CFH 77786]